MKIFVIRHGETEWNKLKLCQGQKNIKLNEIGINQAKIVKEKLENEKIDLIISSPLDRSCKTAEIINENSDTPIIYDDRLKEKAFGKLEGRKIDEFDFYSYWDYYKNLEYDGLENMQDFFKRIYSIP